MIATKRNEAFKKLVAETQNTNFAHRLLELSAFAKGCGARLKFDDTGFELCSKTGAYGRMLVRVDVI